MTIRRLTILGLVAICLFVTIGCKPEEPRRPVAYYPRGSERPIPTDPMDLADYLEAILPVYIAAHGLYVEYEPVYDLPAYTVSPWTWPCAVTVNLDAIYNNVPEKDRIAVARQIVFDVVATVYRSKAKITYVSIFTPKRGDKWDLRIYLKGPQAREALQDIWGNMGPNGLFTLLRKNANTDLQWTRQSLDQAKNAIMIDGPWTK